MTRAAPCVICLGKFDALHRGHAALIARAATLRAESGGREVRKPGSPTADFPTSGRPDSRVVLLGFAGQAEALGWPPRLPLIAPEDRPRVLAGLSAELGLGVDRAIAEASLPFAEIRALRAAAFLERLRRAFAPLLGVVIGEDFRGGPDRCDDAAAFAEAGAAQGLAVAVVPALCDAAGAISSSRVRALLAAGAVADAARLLGRPHRLAGVVVRGDGRGRGLGFSTANLAERGNLDPAPGVYVADAWILRGDAARTDALRVGPLRAGVNIGVLPTIAGTRTLRVEAHLLAWPPPGAAQDAGDLYGCRLELDLLDRLRAEQRFANVDDLRAQIARDIARCADHVPRR